MLVAEFRKSAFANRVLSTLALTIFFIFTALVIVENKELANILPATTARSWVILCGYSFAILSSNYFMAIRGRNFTDWRTELFISANYIVLFFAATMPHLFPNEELVKGSWLTFTSDKMVRKPNYWYVSFLLLSPPLLLGSIRGVRHYFEEHYSK